MPFLMEVTGRHRATLATRVFRFTNIPGGYNTAPGDNPSSAHFRPRIIQAGHYRRTLFGPGGRTSGVAEVDRGTASLDNVDGGLDDMLEYAFDGYPLIIWQIGGKGAAYGTRALLSTGTIEQLSVSWEEITLAVRSRLSELDVPIQDATYLGTTIDGTREDAEGGADLKDAPRLLLYGRALNVPALLLNRWKGVYGVGHRLGQVFSVRDSGSKLTATGQDYPTLAALSAATILSGYWATCRALGLIRIGGNTNAAGQITVDAAEGATLADRTAGQIVRRILIERRGLVPGLDFLEADIAALDAAAPYEVGYWPGTQRVNMLTVVSEILDSVRGWIAPNRQGVFRIGQMRAPIGAPKKTFGKIELLDDAGSGLKRLPTGDEGRGLPVKKVVVEFGRNHAVVTKDNLTGEAREKDPDFVEFATKETRQAELPNPSVAELHKLAPEMVVSTCLVNAADAAAEAQARMALHGVHRDHYAKMVRTEHAAALDLDDESGIRIARFGLAAGRSFRVVGMMENHEEGTTTIDAWG